MLIVLVLLVLFIVVVLINIKSQNLSIIEATLVLSIIFGTLLLISLLLTSIAQINRKISYERMVNKRIEIVSKIEALEIQSGKDIDLGIYSDVFTEVTEFNNTVTRHKYRSKSLWFNWFYNDLIGEIEYIEQIKLKGE